jgi:hypothetical protein
MRTDIRNPKAQDEARRGVRNMLAGFVPDFAPRISAFGLASWAPPGMDNPRLEIVA